VKKDKKLSKSKNQRPRALIIFLVKKEREERGKAVNRKDERKKKRHERAN